MEKYEKDLKDWESYNAEKLALKEKIREEKERKLYERLKAKFEA